MTKYRNKIHFAWLVLIGLCIMVGLSKAAINNTSGLFITPITTELGIGTGDLTLHLSVAAIVTLIFLPIGGKLMEKYSMRYILTIAIVLQAGAYAAFGFMNSVWGWYLLSIPMAVGGVFITVIAGPVLINQWFKKRNGLALGIMGVSVGLLGVIVQPTVGNLIAFEGWRNTYLIVGITVIAIVVPTIIFLLRGSPKEKNLSPYGVSETKSKHQDKHQSENNGITISVAKKSIAFLMLFVFFFIITSISSFSVHIPNYLMNEGFSVAFSGNILSAQMLGVMIGSLAFGYLGDRIGAKNTTLFAMGMGVISMILLINFTSSTAAIVVAVFLFGLLTASIGTLAPMLTTTLFGNINYSQIYSNASLGLAIASIIALPAYGFIFDSTGSYMTALYLIIALLLLNVLCVLLAFWSKNKMVRKGLWQTKSVAQDTP